MTLSQLQATIHALYTGDANTPDSTSGEWAVRLIYIKSAINTWSSTKDVQWNELFTTLTAAATGDKTVTSSTLAYDAPTDFKFLGGYVETVSSSGQRTKWGVITPEEASLKQGETLVGVTDGYAYVTGNSKTGYIINFSSQPTVGETIDYPYYKQAFEPSSGSDVVEMSDPYFAVYFSLSKMYENDGEGDRATFAMDQANNKLTDMVFINGMLPNYQPNQVQDSTIIRTNAGFGA